MENTLKPSLSLIGEGALLKESIEASRLIVEISINRISYALLHNDTQTYKAIESYFFADTKNYNDIGNRLEFIHTNTEILKNNYFSVHVLFSGCRSTLIPAVLFDSSKAELYLKFNHPMDKDDVVAFDQLNITNAVNIYTIHTLLKDKVKALFPAAKISHSYSSLIENLLFQFSDNKASKLVLHVQQKHIQIIQINSGKLIFFNSFAYNTKEDFIYYLLFVMQQLHLNPDTQELLVLGEIEKKTSLADMIFKYIKKPLFGERSAIFKFDKVFEEFPPHHFYNLLNFHL
jgi:hypothetical protein